MLQFELEDTVLGQFEKRMEMYRRKSESAQVPFLFSAASYAKSTIASITVHAALNTADCCEYAGCQHHPVQRHFEAVCQPLLATPFIALPWS